jgi:hypothetical protein
VSTPTSLDLPEGTRPSCVATARGTFAVLDAVPDAGPCERGTALLVPGYTGSKEDFIALLGQLAAGRLPPGRAWGRHRGIGRGD